MNNNQFGLNAVVRSTWWSRICSTVQFKLKHRGKREKNKKISNHNNDNDKVVAVNKGYSVPI